MTSTSRGLRTSALLVAAVLVSLVFATIPSADASAAGPRIDPRLTSQLSSLSLGDKVGAFVHFEAGSVAQQRSLVRNLGLNVAAEFPSVDALFASGPKQALTQLFDEQSVSYIEANRKLRFFQETSRIATRSLVGAGGANGTYLDPAGNPIDGSGVGVAIVDSGILGSHPDFAGSIAKNYKIVCSTPGLINSQTETCLGPTLFLEANDTDTTSGHGTHVAGIASGDGSASSGSYAGWHQDPPFTGIQPERRSASSTRPRHGSTFSRTTTPLTCRCASSTTRSVTRAARPTTPSPSS